MFESHEIQPLLLLCAGIHSFLLHERQQNGKRMVLRSIWVCLEIGYIIKENDGQPLDLGPHYAQTNPFWSMLTGMFLCCA